MTEDERFYHRVRLLQRKTKCSNTVCEDFVQIFKQYVRSKNNTGLRRFDAKAKAVAGTNYLKLHGCPKCNKYVYSPKDHNVNCPFVNVKGDGSVCGYPRYNEAGKPWEIAFFFPLHQRLQALLRIPGFRKLLDYEFTRPRATDPNVMSDIYDSPAWQKFMGPPSQPCQRIGLQGCTDGFQAFNCGTLSFTPIEFSISSLPPALRFKPELMLLLAFLPTNAQASGQKKYWDFFAKFEINSLYYAGMYVVFLKANLKFGVHSYWCLCFVMCRDRGDQGEDVRRYRRHDWPSQTCRNAGNHGIRQWMCCMFARMDERVDGR